MNSDEVFDQIEVIASNSGKNVKQSIVAANISDPLFHRCVVTALDPFITFGIKKVCKVNENHPGLAQINDLTFEILDLLASRSLTGNAALEGVLKHMLSLSPKSAELFRRIVLKDLRAGFSASTVNKVAPDTIHVFECQLSHPLKESQIKEWPVLCEPKYDGVRSLAIVDADGVAKFYSRTGKPFLNYDHIGKELEQVFGSSENLSEESWVIDGEMVDVDFAESVGAMRRKGKQATGTNFRVFDLMTLSQFLAGGSRLPYVTRRKLLANVINRCDKSVVSIPPHRRCHSTAEIEEYYGECRSAGLEGVIVKNLQAPYEKKRSYNWMKIKDRGTVDVPITAFVEGTGKYEGSLGALVVDFNGVSVNVGSGLTDSLRELIWRDRSDYLNQLVEVEFHEVTPDKSLRHPRYSKFRSGPLAIDEKLPEDGVGA